MFRLEKKILVTGSTGLVGSNLIKRLLIEGLNIRATLHRSDPVVIDPRIEYVRCDLTMAEQCKSALKNVGYVFHCAANTSGAATMAATPMVHVTPNVLMNSQLLQAAYDAKVQKFLWLSSTTGYPPSGQKLVKEDEMFEGEPYESYFYVGWMKRFTELLCIMYGEKLPIPMTTIVLRLTNLYGPDDDFEPATSHVTAALIRKVVERQDPVEVWGSGDDIRDVIYVDDVVEAMVVAMDKIESYTAINLGLGKGYSVKEILHTILDIDGYSGAKIRFDGTKPSMIPIRLVDTTKAEKQLGFKAATSLRDGLRKTIKWYRESRAHV